MLRHSHMHTHVRTCVCVQTYTVDHHYDKAAQWHHLPHKEWCTVVALNSSDCKENVHRLHRKLMGQHQGCTLHSPNYTHEHYNDHVQSRHHW